MEQIPPYRRPPNESPNLKDLPPSPDTNFYSLDPKVRYLWLISRIIFWAVIGVILTVVISGGYFSGGAWVAYVGWPLVGLASLAFLHLIWPFISYKYWGYAIRQTDFLIRWGVWRHQVVAVPFARIQHVDSHSGPIERSFGLANLAIHTAGSNMGTMGLPGLSVEYAETLRDYLSKVGHTHANI